jgi:hypothetical protein
MISTHVASAYSMYFKFDARPNVGLSTIDIRCSRFRIRKRIKTIFMVPGFFCGI